MPIAHRLFVKPRGGSVVGQQLGAAVHDVGARSFQGLEHAGMEGLASGEQQALVRGLLHQGVLERVRRVGRHAAPEGQLCPDELRQRGLDLLVGHARHGRQQLVGELATDDAPDLRHRLKRGVLIQPRHQRVLERRRDQTRG